MSQVKIYATRETINQYREQLSQAIHQAIVDAFNYPIDKKFQRFIALDSDDFIYPQDRGAHYVIIEISMFEGRSTHAKKLLIRNLFNNIESQCGILAHAVEITLFETPREHWGIRGQHGDEIQLNYQVNA